MIGSIGQNVGAAQAYQPVAAAPAPAPATGSAPTPEHVPLKVEGGDPPCTSCGREALEKAYQMQAIEKGAASAEFLQQVTSTYAASRPAA